MSIYNLVRVWVSVCVFGTATTFLTDSTKLFMEPSQVMSEDIYASRGHKFQAATFTSGPKFQLLH